MKLQRISNPDEVIFVRKGKCWPDGNGNALNLRGMTDEELAEHDWERWVAPIPDPPTLEELRQDMVVSPWQIRKALNATGKRGQVNAAMNQADQDTQDGWEYANSFERLNPLVITLGAALGLTEEELDDLFTLAASL